MSDNKRRMGIMASFAKAVFKKDGREVFTATVTSGGCFGPNPDLDLINEGYAALKRAIKEGNLPATAEDFNTVAVSGREYAVTKGPAGIDPASLKLLKP